VSAVLDAEPVCDPEDSTRSNAKAAEVARIVSHGVVWTVVLVPAIVQMRRGWIPTGDDANISLRAFQVFTSHSPTVGIYATGLAGTGHRLYDLGPLGSWLLSIPVRLDPTQGTLWGAAVWCGVVLSLSVEALFRYRGWLPAIVIPFLAADLMWLTPVMANLQWNAYFGLVFFMATMALAWVVAGGRLKWWPVLIFTASVAVQSHLIFAVSSVVLVIVAPIIGRRRQPVAGTGWLSVGLLVGVAAWCVPLVQEIRGHPGNVTALVNNAHRLPTLGIGYGLKTLTIAASLKPIFLTAFPANPFADFAFSRPEGSELFGVLLLVELLATVYLAWRSRRHDLATAALIALICCLGAVIGFSSVQQSYELGVTYLVFCLWVIGTLVWMVWVWSIVEVGAAFYAWRRRLPSGHAGPSPSASGWSRRWTEGGPLSSLGIGLAVACLLLLTGVGISQSMDSGWTAVNGRTGVQIRNASSAIERTVRRPGPVAFEIHFDDASMTPFDREEDTNEVLTGVVYRLTSDGWTTGLSRAVSPFFDPPSPRWLRVVVTFHGESAVAELQR
jgi:hypothetical protein